MFCYSWNNGISMKSVDDNYVAQIGEFLFSDYATEKEKNTAFPLYNSGVPILTLDEQIMQIEDSYNVKFEALQKRLNNVLLAYGINQDAKTVILQNEYKELSAQKDLEILELLGGI